MRKTLLVAISILMAAAPLAAQHGGSVKAKTTHVSLPKPSHVTSSPSGSTTHGRSGPKVLKPVHGGGHAVTKTTVHVSRVRTTTTSKPPKTTTATKTTKTTRKATSTALAPSTTPTKVQLKLQRNTNLATKLQSRLPAGTNLMLASAGFRNLGQFVAAVNVSNNLGIPFSQLKTRMVDQGMSLGQAIQDLRPQTSETTIVAHRAESDADAMIHTTEQTTVSKSKKAKKRTGGN
ncbi:MAG: hypothetical protein ABIQ52_19880 [Vicinamibacterales bacterium]